MTDLEEIRKELAVKHEILLSKNDPALLMVSITDKLLEQYTAKLDMRQAEIAKGLLKEVKASAGKIVTEGTEYACQQIEVRIKSAMSEAEGRIMARLDNHLKAMDDMRHAADSHRKASIAAMVISLACVVVVGWLNVFL